MKVIFILIIWLNSGAITSTVEEVDACPNKGAVFAKYEKLKADGALLDWAALCTPVTYNPTSTPNMGV